MLPIYKQNNSRQSTEWNWVLARIGLITIACCLLGAVCGGLIIGALAAGISSAGRNTVPSQWFRFGFFIGAIIFGIAACCFGCIESSRTALLRTMNEPHVKMGMLYREVTRFKAQLEIELDRSSELKERLAIQNLINVAAELESSLLSVIGRIADDDPDVNAKKRMQDEEYCHGLLIIKWLNYEKKAFKRGLGGHAVFQLLGDDMRSGFTLRIEGEDDPWDDDNTAHNSHLVPKKGR